MLAEPATSYLPDSMMAPRIACVGDIEVVRVAGNHHLHLEEPQKVFEVVERFLEGLREKEREAEPRDSFASPAARERPPEGRVREIRSEALRCVSDWAKR